MKKTLTKIAVFLILMVVMLCLCACHEHTYSEATCTTPATCSECGKTTGGLGEHSFAEATYTRPEKCIYCGEERGEKLAPYFEEKGLDMYTVNLSSYSGASIPYTASLNDDTAMGCTNDFTLTWLRVIQNNPKVETVYYPDGVKPELYEPEAGILTDEDGYEWRVLHARAKVANSNYDKIYWRGLRWYITPVDYYTGKMIEEDAVVSDEKAKARFTIEYNGETYDNCCAIWWNKFNNGGSGNSFIDGYFFVRVPVGYDGITIAFINTMNHDDDYFNAGLPIEEVGEEGLTFVRLA